MTDTNYMGQTVTCRISGITGLVTGYAQYITGCNQCLVEPKSTDSDKPARASWVDEQRLDVDTTIPRFVIDNGSNPGCGLAPPIR